VTPGALPQPSDPPAGIALALAAAGCTVALIDAAPAALERAVTTIEAALATGVANGRLTSEKARARRRRIAPATGMAVAGDGDLAVEAVFDDLAIKRAVFAELDRIVARRTVLAINTSTLDIDALVNEGASHLADGIAGRASDIDLVRADGYGFPAARGGPEQLAAVHDEVWRPAPLLVERVATGQTLTGERRAPVRDGTRYRART